jgi:sensor histidine kinase YesM
LPLIPQQHFEGDWRYVNLYGLLLGLVVGHSIILFNTLFTGNPIQLPEAALVLWVSTCVLCTLANTLALSISLPAFATYVHQQPILAFYIFSALGLSLGTILGVLSATLFFPIAFIAVHKGLLFLTLLASVAVCMGIQLYEWQAAKNHQKQIKQEVEVLKLDRLTKQAQLKAIQTKINPHLLYNALNSIAGLIHLDRSKAEDMTIRLAQLYRYDINDDQWITIQEELHIAKNYLEIEHVRFGNLLNYEFTCDADLLKVAIPRFLVQPLIENAVKHGLAQAPHILIQVQISRQDEKILIEVFDTGGKFPSKITAGYGLRSIYTRLGIHYGTDYAIKVANQPQKSISLLLPLSPLSS